MTLQTQIALKSVVAYLTEFFPLDTSIIQFGSSIYDLDKQVLDVDLMILANESTYFIDFKRNLNFFKSQLLTGIPNCGFKPNTSKESIHQLEAGIRSFRTTDLEIFPAFYFGPYPIDNLSDVKSIWFHIKGLINIDQYKLFCNYFPFHATSINHNNIILKGHFDPTLYSSEININNKELSIWVNSLYKRLEVCHDSVSAFKCFKKLCLIVCIRYGFVNSEINVLMNNIKSITGRNDFITISENSSLDLIQSLFQTVRLHLKNSHQVG